MPAPSTRTYCRPVALIFALCLASPQLTAQSPAPEAEINRRPPGFGFGPPSDSLSRGDVAFVTIRNPHKVPLEIKALLFEPEKLQIDSEPFVVCDATPFLDRVVVKATNVGWGKMKRGRLSYYSANTWPEPDARIRPLREDGPKVAALLDLSPNAFELGDDDAGQYVSMRIGKKAQPFQFAYGGSPITTALDVPEVSFAAMVSRQYVGDSWVSTAGSGPIDPNVHSGLVTFLGLFEPSNAESERVRFYARHFQKVQLDEEGIFLNRVFGTRLQGALYPDWRMAFGNMLASLERLMMQSTSFGTVMDLDDGSDSRIQKRVPANLTIPPEQEVEFSVTFVSTRSLVGLGKLICEYRLGNSDWRRYPLQPKPVAIKTRVLRPMSFDFDETRIFLTAIRSQDPDVVKKAREILAAGLPDDDKTALGAAERSAKIRQFMQAVWAASEWDGRTNDVLTACDVIARWGSVRARLPGVEIDAMAEDIHLAPRIRLAPIENEAPIAAPVPDRQIPLRPIARQRRAVQEIVREDDMRQLEEFFPVLCSVALKDGVRLALKWYAAGNDSLMRIGLCVPGFRDALRQSGESIELVLAGKRNALSNFDLAMAIVSGNGEWRGQLKNRQRWPESAFIFAWASGKVEEGELDEFVRGQLEDPELGPYVMEQMVRAFCATRNERMWESVHNYAMRVSRDARHTDSLLACLHYFTLFKRHSSVPLLKLLEDYPYSSVVRGKARSLRALVRPEKVSGTDSPSLDPESVSQTPL